MFNFLKSQKIALGLLFLLIVFQLAQNLSLIPSNMAIFDSVKMLYLSAPYLWLGIGAFTSTVVFVNIYVPGPIIVFAAVLSSNGRIDDFIMIATTVTVSATLACVLSNYWGTANGTPKNQPRLQSWIWGHTSLYTLGYWYYKTEMKRTCLFKNLIITGLFLFPYSIVVCYLLYPLQGAISEYTNYYLIAGLLCYIVFRYITRSLNRTY